MNKALLAVLLLGLAWLTSCRARPEPSPSPSSSPVHLPAPNLLFKDATEEAGIHFKHYRGSFGGRYMPEIMGSGCAWIDYDNSGRQSLLLLNGTDFRGHRRGAHWPALYRNNGDGTYTDVTREVGLAVDMYAMGVAVGDYDNDGWADLFVTTLTGNRLFHNRQGHFEDVTDPAGVRGLADAVPWSTSAAFVDYDNDGLLDIFVTYYVKWTPAHNFFLPPTQGTRGGYNSPESYPGQTSRLFHNLGNGRFEDVTDKAGIDKAGKGLGVAVLMRPDGWPDIFVANDLVPNFYFVNQKNGTFTEEGLHRNLATAEGGKAHSGMGADFADLDGNDRPAVVVANLPTEMLSLARQTPHGEYLDVAARSGVGEPSRLFSGFGCFFFDYDLDGRPDILVANGMLDSRFKHFLNITYAEVPLLFHNAGDGTFDDVAARSGLTTPLVGRGAAWADSTGRGWADFVITPNVGAAHLYRNLGLPDRHALELTLQGTTSNRSAIGAQVYLTADGRPQHQWVKSGSSYCSQSQLPLLFGLGAARDADDVAVQWPGSPAREVLGRLAAGRVTVVQGRGVVATHPWQP
ncbi:MAG TPA: CRTAC1 family protein [Candidatus Xenobia bacterium]|jgi:hypothetical protein